MGSVARNTGRLEEAAAVDAEAARGLTELVAMDRTNAAWRTELARAQIESAQLEFAKGNMSDAESLLNTALGTIQAERGAGTTNRNLRLYEAQTLIALGEVAERRQNQAAAHERWAQARSAIDGAVRVGADPDFLATWTKSLLLLGDTGAAQPVLRELAAMGGTYKINK